MSTLLNDGRSITICLTGVVVLVLGGCARPRMSVPSPVTANGIARRTGLPAPPEPTSQESPALPPGISLDRPLTADDAAAIALWRNPQLHVDLAALGLARADVIDAGLLRNPRLDMLFPVGLKPFELLFNFPADAIWARPGGWRHRRQLTISSPRA